MQTVPRTAATVATVIIIIRHFISLEPAFWATLLPLYSTVDCTVGGSKESIQYIGGG